MKSAARIALGVLGGIVIGNPILLYAIQEKLIFFPVPINAGNREAIRKDYEAVREITVTGADGVKLHGWMQKARGVARAPLVIYFGGNEEDVSFLPARKDRVEGWSLAVLNYRGYGLSEGEPGEQAIFGDALAIYDSLSRRDDVERDRIALMGRSLGSGVATYLATQRPVKAVILVTPYDSIADIAGEKFWFAPVGLILKHRFESIDRAPKVRVPALFLVAAQDEAIPVARSRRLFDAWAGPKTWHLARGEDHNTIAFYSRYWPAVGEFLASIPR